MVMKTIFAFMMVLSLSIPVWAQDQAGGDEHQPPSADEIVSKMQSKLKLTQDQVTAITPIIEKYTSKREELHQSMEDGTSDRDGLRSQMKELRTDETQELSQVLSGDQMNQWKQMQGRRKPAGESNGGVSWGAGGGSREAPSGSGG